MTMQVREHLAAARELLDAADRRYAAGDRIGASERLWQAAVHAIQAGARHHGWDCDGSIEALVKTADRLEAEHDDIQIGSAFAVSANFLDNCNEKSALYGYMDDFDFQFSRPTVSRLVFRVRQALAQDSRKEGNCNGTR